VIVALELDLTLVQQVSRVFVASQESVASLVFEEFQGPVVEVWALLVRKVVMVLDFVALLAAIVAPYPEA
jgi:hypothetical protein